MEGEVLFGGYGVEVTWDVVYILGFLGFLLFCLFMALLLGKKNNPGWTR